MPCYGIWISSTHIRKLLLVGSFLTFAWGLFTLRSNFVFSIGNNLPDSSADEISKYAYATLLTADGDIEFPDVNEPYLRAARLLTYQLLYNPTTRGNNTDIPFLILVTGDVPQKHRDILIGDGAIVVPVESLAREWINPKWSRWNDVLAKLNLWKMTEYDKILFLDADTIIFRPLDNIFSHPATTVQRTLTFPANENLTRGDLPDTYMIAGVHDIWIEIMLPPVPGNEFYAKNNYMNAGFFLCQPSQSVFDYYISLLNTPGQFDPTYPEQNLLNYAHRVDGRMPWKDLGPQWNQKGGNKNDYDKGLKSIHHKWWRPIPDEFLQSTISDAVREMEDFFQERSSNVV